MPIRHETLKAATSVLERNGFAVEALKDPRNIDLRAYAAVHLTLAGMTDKQAADVVKEIAQA